MPEIPHAAAFELAPDWVCEVLSHHNAAKDRTRKMPIYAAEQVGHVWLVDPAPKTLEVYRRHEMSWLLVSSWAGDALLHAEPFEEIELELGALCVTRVDLRNAAARVRGDRARRALGTLAL